MALEISESIQAEQGYHEIGAVVGEAWSNVLEPLNFRWRKAAQGTLALFAVSTLALGIQSRSTPEVCDTATCHTLEAGLQVPTPDALPQVTPRTIRASAARAVSANPPSPPPTLEVKAPPLTAEKVPDRTMSYETFKTNAHKYLAKLPSLDALSRVFPNNVLFNNYLQQTERILEFNQGVNVSPEDYRAFRLDTTHNTAFKGVGQYETQIQPKMFIIHWTGRPYNNDPVLLAKSMINTGGNRVDYYMDKNGKTYQLFESDHNKPGHALPELNKFSQGVEIEASNMMEYTPEQIKQAVLLAVNFCRRNGLPVDETTVVGHYAADMIFNNPYYNPETGDFIGTVRVRKSDPPQSLMQIIVVKAQALDAALGPR